MVEHAGDRLEAVNFTENGLSMMFPRSTHLNTVRGPNSPCLFAYNVPYPGQASVTGQLSQVGQALHNSLTSVPLVNGAHCGAGLAPDIPQLEGVMDRCEGGLRKGALFAHHAQQTQLQSADFIHLLLSKPGLTHKSLYHVGVLTCCSGWKPGCILF